MAEKRPKPPRGLDKPGRDLWRAIQGSLAEDWGLDARELHLLERRAHTRSWTLQAAAREPTAWPDLARGLSASDFK